MVRIGVDGVSLGLRVVVRDIRLLLKIDGRIDGASGVGVVLIAAVVGHS